VSGQAKSHTECFARDQGISVAPSGRLPSPRSRPWGSRVPSWSPVTFSVAIESGRTEQRSTRGSAANTSYGTSLAQILSPRRILTSLHWRQGQRRLRQSRANVPRMPSSHQQLRICDGRDRDARGVRGAELARTLCRPGGEESATCGLCAIDSVPQVAAGLSHAARECGHGGGNTG